MTSLQMQMDNNDKWIRFLIVALILSLIWLVMSSCGCNYYVNKAKKKCGYQTDTLIISDTVFTKQIKTDTLFKYYQKDSIIVREGKLVMKYYYNSHDSTVYLQGKCLTDTVIKIIKVPTTTIEADWFSKYKWFVYIGLILLCLYFVIKLFK